MAPNGLIRREEGGGAEQAAAVLVPLLFGVYPISIVLAANTSTSWWIVLRAVGVVAAGTGALLWLLRRMWPNLAGRALTLATWYLLMGWYAFLLLGVKHLGVTLETISVPTAVVYIVASAAASIAIVRPWRRGRRSPVTLAFVGLALVGINVPGIVKANTASIAGWVGAAQTLNTVPPHEATGAPARDIYYIVLDGFGRADTLRRIYDVDLASTVEQLRARGFFIADRARSNYAQTSLSLSSLLNFNYLDPLARAVGTSSNDREPTEYLIQHNALMDLAHKAGYHVIGIGADDVVTQHIDQADVCVCRRYGLDGFEQAVVGLTPWVFLSNPWTYAAHRRKIVDAFAAIEHAASEPGPRLVFAHILVPHPPFVFAADGSSRSGGVFTLNDASQFLGTERAYVEGYREQAEFAVRRITAVIDDLLGRPGAPPVIIVHGDHGPGSRLHWENPGASDLSERMDIFAAYYFPKGRSRLYPTITPINGARALASDYLGADLPPVADVSSFSTWSHPYAFIPVAPETPAKNR